MDVTLETQNHFIETGNIAVHYCEDILPGKDRCSTNPEDYKQRAARVLRRMRRFCEKGALAVGYYNEHPPNRMLIGLIPSGSKIEAEVHDLWKNEYYPSGDTCYKTIQLKNYFEVDLNKNRQLESCIPRGNVFVRWKVNGVDRTIKYLYKIHHGLIEKRDRNVYDLSYAQLEVLCSEYLRMINTDYRIDHFVTPVGRSQKSTDVDGINEQGTVLAQVSFSQDENEIKEKMGALLQYDDINTKLVYFGPEFKRKQVIDPIKYIPIEEVFEYIKKTSLIDSLLPLI